ncbi:kunitz-type protease inhibitor 2-like isoform X2 [Protopterus annectens]|uniref:kunitz-type protease inhibitor 2-like isoform X2 n=1 Tax=Protopterus annectens TaxID=7888 RepID=UPI001CFB0769|nr:kunitz-type protease inhibitor 2-like isoform X2 [Protopterus annectens]
MAPDQVLRFGFLTLLIVFGKALADDNIKLDSKTSSDERNLTALCLVKFETGNCRASLTKWWYVAENQTCAEFIYGGCGGNSNNYDDEQKCLESCQGVSGSGKLNDASGISKRMTNLKAAQKSDGILEDDDLEALSPEPLKNAEGDQFDYQESCAAAKVVGPCRASMPRWYFNAETHDCEPFIYGGCQGNKNNYMSKELCMEKCSEAENTSFDPLSFQFFHHSRTTIILAGVLGVLALILITGMVCFFIRLAKKNRTTTVATIWSPPNDKECLMNSAYTL